MTADTPEEDLVSIPVPEGATLLGSYHIRRRDGTNEIWLAYDVPGSDVDVERIDGRFFQPVLLARRTAI